MKRLVCSIAALTMLAIPFVNVEADDTLTNGLVLHYSFDADGGATIADESGMLNNGAVNGPTWTSGGVLGGAYTFDAVNDYINVTNSPSLGVSNLTISAWVYITDGTGNDMAIAEKGPHLQSWDFQVQRGGQVGHNYLILRGGSITALFGTQNLSTGVWHHVVGTIAGTHATIYVDGLLDVSGNVTAVGHTSSALYIGMSYSPNACFGGRMDDVRMYNRALSDAEVSQLYDAAGIQPPANPTNHLCGSTTGVLTQANSPYQVTGNVIVPAGGSLMIEPGVTLNFQGHYYIDVDGQVCSAGTASNQVLFTAADHTNGWAGVRIMNNWNNNVFSNTVFEYGRAPAPYNPPYQSPDMEGAGIYLNDGKVDVESCIFRYNKSTVHGSAFSGWYCVDATIRNSVFSWNDTTWDCAGYGAIAFHLFAPTNGHSMNVVVSGCDISHNTARDQAPGVGIMTSPALDPGAVVIVDNVIYSNTCYGAWAPGSSAVGYFVGGRIINNVFFGNVLVGGAVGPIRSQIHLESSTDFRNNIVWGGIGQDVVLDVVGSPVVQYNCIQGGYAGTGNISNDPLFANQSMDDFSLTYNSPCIDAGTVSGLTLPGTDFLGNPRVVGGSVDMGAVERSSISSNTVIFTVAGSPDSYGSPTPYGYGSMSVSTGTSVTNTISCPVAGGTGIRYICTGWTGSGDVPSSGSGTNVEVTLTQYSCLIWQWNTEYYLNTASGAGGSVDVTSGWQSRGSNVTITATPLDGYRLLLWSGDVPSDMATDNPLVLTMDKPRTISAVFVSSAGEIAGSITGVLTQANSPYQVTGNIVVPAGRSLLIEAGVTLNFQGHYYMDVDGQICSAGTASNQVVFTAADHTNGWAGVRIMDNWNNNVFSNTVFEYGRASAGYVSPCLADMEGAGIYVEDGKVDVENCIFRYNTSTAHGSAFAGFYCIDATIRNSVFSWNETKNDCAGYGALTFHLFAPTNGHSLNLQVTGCEISHNTARDEGAGITIMTCPAITPGTVLIANNVLYSNTCYGAWAPGSSTVGYFAGGRVINNVFFGNVLAAGAAGPTKCQVHLESSVDFRNNIVWGGAGHDTELGVAGSPVVQCNCIQGGYSGTGNISSDPLFMNQSIDDFSLACNSPCIDAGTVSGLTLPGTDFLGNPRVVGASVDMGAIERSSISSNTVMFTVAGSPGSYGSPTPYGYRTYTMDSGITVSDSVATPVSGSTGVRYVCTGWTGLGSTPASGSGNTVAFTIMTNSTLTWLWNTEYYLNTASGAGGSVDVGAGWQSGGSVVTLTAAPLAGYTFTGWTGDVPGGSSTVNPLPVTMDQPRTINATFSAGVCSVGGRIFYTGHQSGTIRVEAFDDAGYVNRVGYTTMLSVGQYTINSLPAGRSYWVRAYVDGNGNQVPDDLEPIGSYSGNPISNLVASCSGIDITLRRLSAPQGLTAAGGADAIVLSWEPNPEPGIAGYKVYRFDNEWLRFDLLNAAPVAGTTFVDDTVVVGETYYYFITAVIRSDYTGSYMESPASSIVGATAGTVVLWMPDYYGTTGSVARLRINAADARGILAKDISITVSYDPTVLTPLSQVDAGQATVKKTALTEWLSVSDNSLSATGQVTITATDPGAGSGDSHHATLHILGCSFETEAGPPIPGGGSPKVPGIIEGWYSIDGGVTWVDINDGMNINDGRSYTIDLGEMANATNCIVCVDDLYGGVCRYSDIANAGVKVVRNGANLGDVAQVNYYLAKYVDEYLNVQIGADDALYMFNLDDTTTDYQQVVAYVEYDQGSTLDGEGHLFDVLFKVADAVPQGRQVTNRFVNVSLKNADGNPIAVDCSDTAVFSVQSNYILGDINGDGVVDVSGDFTLAMKLAVGQRAPTAYELMAGDIDGDGQITKVDASLIKRIAQGESINPEDIGSGGGGPSGAPAGSGYQLSLAISDVLPGSYVQIPVNINNAKDVASLNLRINYDQSVLTLQSVTNTALTSAFGLEYQVGAGYVDIVLCSDSQLVSGSGTILYLTFLVLPDAVIGSMSDLTISDRGVANQFGLDMGLKSGVEVNNGGVTMTRFEVLSMKRQGANGVKVEWPTIIGRFYDIQYSTNILKGFMPLSTNILGTGAHSFFTDPDLSGKGVKFYRIKLK